MSLVIHNCKRIDKHGSLQAFYRSIVTRQLSMPKPENRSDFQDNKEEKTIKETISTSK
jgi:hypothetical protein